MDTFSISNSLSKGSVYESDSIYKAYRDDAMSRVAGDECPLAISNEQIKKGDVILDTYRVEDDAIHGGMGSVWRVHHQSWDTDLAMKRPQPRFFAEAGERRKEAFIAECEHWINLGLHPNIVSCYYVREIGGVPTIFSEWMDGGSLKDAITSGRLYGGTEEEVQARILDIAIQAARGLQYAHEQGLIHQDVKPGNILLTRDWDAKVADFGLAMAQSQLSDGKRSLSGGYTPAYCPREQAEGAMAEKWMDVYAWALTVMEMYAGKRLWRTGAEARSRIPEISAASRVAVPSTVRLLLESSCAGRAGGACRVFDGIVEELKSCYAAIAGRLYPRLDSRAAANTADSLNNRALSFFDLGKRSEAEKLWKEGLEANSNHAPSVYNNSIFELDNGEIRMDEALSRLENLKNRTGSAEAEAACDSLKAYNRAHVAGTEPAPKLLCDERREIMALYVHPSGKTAVVDDRAGSRRLYLYDLERDAVIQEYAFRRDVGDIQLDAQGEHIVCRAHTNEVFGARFDIYRARSREPFVTIRGMKGDLVGFAGDRLTGFLRETTGGVRYRACDIAGYMRRGGDFLLEDENPVLRRELYCIDAPDSLGAKLSREGKRLIVWTRSRFFIHDALNGRLICEHVLPWKDDMEPEIVDDEDRFVLWNDGSLYDLRRGAFCGFELFPEAIGEKKAEHVALWDNGDPPRICAWRVYRIWQEGPEAGKTVRKAALATLCLDGQRPVFRLSTVESTESVLKLQRECERLYREINARLDKGEHREALRLYREAHANPLFTQMADYPGTTKRFDRICSRRGIRSCALAQTASLIDERESVLFARDALAITVHADRRHQAGRASTVLFCRCRCYDLERGSMRWELELPEGATPSYREGTVDVSADGKWLALLVMDERSKPEAYEKNVRLIAVDCETGKCVSVIRLAKSLRDLYAHFTPDGDVLYCGGNRKGIFQGVIRSYHIPSMRKAGRTDAIRGMTLPGWRMLKTTEDGRFSVKNSFTDDRECHTELKNRETGEALVISDSMDAFFSRDGRTVYAVAPKQRMLAAYRLVYDYALPDGMDH